MDDLKSFRQLDSITPGHPENFVTGGVEVSTGPLGQGISNAVGMAIAERHLAATFNKPDCEVCVLLPLEIRRLYIAPPPPRLSFLVCPGVFLRSGPCWPALVLFVFAYVDCYLYCCSLFCLFLLVLFCFFRCFWDFLRGCQSGLIIPCNTKYITPKKKNYYNPAFRASGWPNASVRAQNVFGQEHFFGGTKRDREAFGRVWSLFGL